MPLDSTRDHIDFIINQIEKWDSSEIIYPKARDNIVLSAQNHVNGLKIIKNILIKTVIKPATDLQKTLEKKGTKTTVEALIRKHWTRQVVEYYNLVERFNLNFNNQKLPILPFETYYWVQSILADMKLDVPVVIEAGNQFINHSFEDTIIEPLSVGLEIGGGSIQPGSLQQIDISDILEGYKISHGYVISYIRGEFRNILLWPILVHELFHILDREKGLVKNLLVYAKDLPTLSEDSATNSRWITEIFMDIFSAKYFGPMYLLSLVNYYERLPYSQTLDHPEMAIRLKVVQQYVNDAEVAYTDIFDKCKACCTEMASTKINDILEAEKFSKEKEEKITKIYKIISDWFDQSKISSFRIALKHYQLQTRSDENDKTFTDPIYTFDEIANFFFDNEISLAIDTRILLNVIMAQNKRYDSEKHFEIINESILKWKIREEWNRINSTCNS
jgi:hypothetical protein